MWISLSPENTDEVARFVHVIHQMGPQFLIGAQYLRWQMRDGKAKLLWYDSNEAQISLSFLDRRFSKQICVAFQGSLPPKAILNLVFRESVRVARQDNFDSATIVRPNAISYKPLIDLLDLIPSYPGVILAKKERTSDQEIWHIRASAEASRIVDHVDTGGALDS